MNKWQQAWNKVLGKRDPLELHKLFDPRGKVIPFFMLGPHLRRGKPVFYQRQAVPRDVRRRLGWPNSARVPKAWRRKLVGNSRSYK